VSRSPRREGQKKKKSTMAFMAARFLESRDVRGTKPSVERGRRVVKRGTPLETTGRGIASLGEKSS